MKATNKDKAQKMISAKIVAKLVELAAKFVIPCIKTSTPGKYTAKEIWQGKDSFGNNLWWSIDEEHNGDELSVAITAEDFTAEEIAEIGYTPQCKVQFSYNRIFGIISKFEQLAGIRLADVAKFVIGEPAKVYETERAKVVLFDYAKQKIVTKTKTITIISDSLAIYLNKKDYYTFCLKINGKWIDVYHMATYYDLAENIERMKKIITYESTKSGAEKYIANNNDKYADYARMILAELEAMDKLNAEASNTQAADNVTADSDSNANVVNDSKANAKTADSTGNDTANEPKEKQQHTDADSPQKDSGTPINQCGREIAVLSDFRGKGDKVYRQSGENRNMGIYCGKSSVSQETPRGSPAKTSIYYLTRV